MPAQVPSHHDGTRLAHYEITLHLGSGGMGDVYQATDSKLSRSVAIKLLPEAFAHDAERLARFQREARVLASLNHPHIVAIHGLAGDPGRGVEERTGLDALALGRGALGSEVAAPLLTEGCKEAAADCHGRADRHRTGTGRTGGGNAGSGIHHRGAPGLDHVRSRLIGGRGVCCSRGASSAPEASTVTARDAH